MTNAKQNLENKTIGGNEMKELLKGKINGETLLNEAQATVVLEAINYYGKSFVKHNEEKLDIALKGHQFKDPKKVYEQINKLTSGRLVINKIPVAGITNLIYAHASGLEIKKSSKMEKELLPISDIVAMVDQDDMLKRKAIAANEDKAKVRITVTDQEEAIDDFSGCFIAFEKYGAKVDGMKTYKYITKKAADKIELLKKELSEINKIPVKLRSDAINSKIKATEEQIKVLKRKGNPVLAVTFEYEKRKNFIVEFPYIDKDLYLYRNGNKYVAMYTISNKLELLAGNTKELKLLHPYAWMSKKLIEAWSEEDGTVREYDYKTFHKIVEGIRNKENICHTFNRKLEKILDNVKKFSWQKNEDEAPTPVIYVEKGNSSVGTYSFSRNILFDLTYDQCVTIGKIPGVDFLTGSTSTPAKRCKIAYGWHVTGRGANIKLERKPGFSEGICDYVSELKISYPAFVKTSAKRDNCATAKDTVNLLPECQQVYDRKFISNTGSQIVASTLNKVFKTLWVAKIDLYENIEKELVDLGLYPNVNDCFLFNINTLNKMTSLFKKPGEDELTYMTPGAGSKCIGAFRDKGSVTGVMNRYLPLVSYECPDEKSAERLAIAVKQMKGEEANVTVNGNVVVFEIDVIANPSTGRDNVAALVLQSCMEQKAILEGKTYAMSEEEVANIDVVELVQNGKYDHKVVLFDRIEKKVVYDFGYTAILLEDFFWQPKHDNQLHCKETDVALNYHQAIDGFKTMLPLLYKVMIKSLDFESIRENMTLLGLKYIALNNDTQIEKETIDETDDEDLLF